MFVHRSLGLVAGVLALSCASIARAQTFHDDFNGTSLDPSVWSVELGAGQLAVGGGVATLTCSGNPFPVATTIQDPFPSDGDFAVTVGMRYTQVAYCGDGFGATDNFHGEGCSPFKLWQDSGGWYVYCGSQDYTLLSPSPNTDYHVYEWDYVNGSYLFYLDGSLITGGSCAPRPTYFFFGHPHPITCNQTNWTSFQIDFVDIHPIGAVTTGETTWGHIKATYR
jgi:hypothetical protein